MVKTDDIVKLGMKLAEGDGCIPNIGGAYFLLDYVNSEKEPLSGDAKTIYDELKESVGRELRFDFKGRAKALLQAVQSPDVNNQAYRRRGSDGGCTRDELSREFEKILEKVDPKDYGALREAIDAMIRKYNAGQGFTGYCNRKKPKNAVKFGNYLGSMLKRFGITKGPFATRMNKYLTDNHVEPNFKRENISAMLLNYLNGSNYPKSETLAIIIGTFDYLNRTRPGGPLFKRTNQVRPGEFALKPEDFALEPVEFFKTVFIQGDMTKEEKDLFCLK